jgi:hypothetical protein
MKDRFPDMVRISERTSEIRTNHNGGSGRVGVKGQDERQSTAPLTPTRPQREPARSFCLTAEEAVIHGAQIYPFTDLPFGEGQMDGRIGEWGACPPTHRDKAAMNGAQIYPFTDLPFGEGQMDGRIGEWVACPPTHRDKAAMNGAQIYPLATRPTPLTTDH